MLNIFSSRIITCLCWVTSSFSFVVRRDLGFGFVTRRSGASKLQLVRTADALNDYIQQIMNASTNGMIIVDGDNVRGKTKFSMSKEVLCMKVEQWRSITNLAASVILLFDHGSEHAAFYKPGSGISVVFSGPILKADDVIARDVLYCQNMLNSSVVAIVTEDAELKKRCRKNSVASASSRRKLSREKKRNKPAMEELSYDMNDRKVMTVDSTKFADMLLKLPTITTDAMDQHGSADTLMSDQSEIGAETVSIDGTQGNSANDLQEYRRRLETLIQQESKLRYEMQKLENIVNRQTKPSRGASKRKVVHRSVHERIQEIQLKTDAIVLATQNYIRSFSANMSNPLHSTNTMTLSVSNKVSTDSMDPHMIDHQKLLSVDENTIASDTELIDRVKEYNISQDFYERGSDLILNYFSKYRQRQLSRGGHKQGYMEETWERVILAERMRRLMLLSTDSIMLYKNETDILTLNSSLLSSPQDNPAQKYVKRINSRLFIHG